MHLLQAYSLKCLEVEFYELPLYGVLRSSGTLGLAQEVPRIVGVSPVLHYLALRYAEHVDGPHLHTLTGRSDPLKLSPVGPAHGDAGRRPIPFSPYGTRRLGPVAK